jgi:hypothetical protein
MKKEQKKMTNGNAITGWARRRKQAPRSTSFPKMFSFFSFPRFLGFVLADASHKIK